MATSPRFSPSLVVSALEFRKMVTSADVTKIYKLLVDHPMLFPRYLHFSALNRTLKRQEILLKQTEEELDMAFHDMTDHDFYDVFTFFITRKLNEQWQSSPPQSTTSRQSTPHRCPTLFPSQCYNTLHSSSPASYSLSPQPETIAPRSPRTISRCPMGQRESPIDQIRTRRCSNYGEWGHHIKECPNFCCIHCNGQGHIEISCLQRHKFTVLPTSICLSPAGQVLHYSDGMVMTRPYTRSCVGGTQSSRSSSFLQ